MLIHIGVHLLVALGVASFRMPLHSRLMGFKAYGIGLHMSSMYTPT